MLTRPNMRFLLLGRRRYLLDEQFNAGLTRWTITDTESKITVSNGNLNFSGGKAASAWRDPAAVSKQFWARVAGLTIEWQVTFPGTGSVSEFGFSDGSLDSVALEAHHFVAQNNGTFQVGWQDAARVYTPASYSAAQVLWFRIVCKASGAYYYVSTDERLTWKLIWVDSSVTTTPLYAFVESYNAALTASRCLVYQGYAKPAVYSGTPTAPTPTAGAELVVNGGFDADTDWTKEVGWAIGSGVASHNTTDYSSIYQALTLTAGTWYAVVFTNSAQLDFAFPGFTTAGIGGGTNTIVIRTTGSGNIAFYANTADGRTLDNVSTKPLTLSSCLTLAADPGTRYGVVDSAPTLTAGNPCGHWIWVDDEANPLYGVLAYHDGTSGYLEKNVNGTYTQLVKATATYSAAAQCRSVAVLDGSTPKVGLFYNGAAVGSAQSITDSGFGTKVCGFSTLSTNTPGQVDVHTGIGV